MKFIRQIKGTHLLLLGGAMLIGLVYLNNRGSAAADAPGLAGAAVTIYKSPTCGCCANYVSYLKRAGLNVTVKDTWEMDSIKKQYRIPADMESCHTAVIGDYVVEGHIPVPAIAKLMKEKPGLRGLALPGMPSGSPGMPGTQNEPMEIYSLPPDGSPAVFVRM